MAKRKKGKPRLWIVVLLSAALAVFVMARVTMWHPPKHGHSVRVAVTERPPMPEVKPELLPEATAIIGQTLPLPPISTPTVTPEPTPQPQQQQQQQTSIPKLAIPPVADGTHPRIAIVIDDMGLNMVGSMRAIKLPPPITLSYIPYSSNLPEQAAKAVALGHELLLHMPMEPMGDADPGPGALLTSLTPEEIRLRFEKALDRFSGYDGVNNHMGSKFTADNADMEVVISVLKERDLFFLDSRTGPKSVGAKLAEENGLPYATRDVFLDDDMNASAVREQLLQTEHVARHKGYAVAIGHPHPATLSALEAWIPEAEKAGFVFVPVRELVNR